MTDREPALYAHVPAELLDRLRAQAVREDRSMASLVRVVLEAYLTAQEARADR